MMFLMNLERMNEFSSHVYINSSELICSSRPPSSIFQHMSRKICLEGHRSFFMHSLWCLLWFYVSLLFCEFFFNGSSCRQSLTEIAVSAEWSLNDTEFVFLYHGIDFALWYRDLGGGHIFLILTLVTWKLLQNFK